jgi:exonuclease III
VSKITQTTEWMQNQDPSICSIQETYHNITDRHHLRVKGWKNILHAYGPKKQVGIAILMFDKIDFKSKLIRRDKEGHNKSIKGKKSNKRTLQFLTSVYENQGYSSL